VLPNSSFDEEYEEGDWLEAPSKMSVQNDVLRGACSG